jgi:acyl carrier protein
MINEIKQILEKVKGSPGLAKTMPDSANIIDDVGLDSLEMMDFMLEVESHFEMEIDFERLEFEYLESIEKFSDFLSREKAAGME